MGGRRRRRRRSGSVTAEIGREKTRRDEIKINFSINHNAGVFYLIGLISPTPTAPVGTGTNAGRKANDRPERSSRLRPSTDPSLSRRRRRSRSLADISVDKINRPTSSSLTARRDVVQVSKTRLKPKDCRPAGFGGVGRATAAFGDCQQTQTMPDVSRDVWDDHPFRRDRA